MFSFLGVAVFIRNIVQTWSKKLGRIIYWGMFISLAVCMTIEIVKSFQKLSTNLTGTNVQHAKFQSIDDFSATVCRVNFTGGSDLHLTVNGRKIEEWLHLSQEEDKDIFLWFYKAAYKCKSFPLRGEEVEFTYHFGKTYGERNIFIDVHQTGSFDTNNYASIDHTWLQLNTTLKLEASQIHQLKDRNLCSEKENFDECKQAYLNKYLDVPLQCSRKR